MPRNRYLQVHTVVPSDGGVLQKLGEIYDRLGDKQQAFQYYSDVMLFPLTFESRARFSPKFFIVRPRSLTAITRRTWT